MANTQLIQEIDEIKSQQNYLCGCTLTWNNEGMEEDGGKTPRIHKFSKLDAGQTSCRFYVLAT
jgi:hypothetical protein